MAILDANGNPIISSKGGDEYRPQNMVVLATLVNKISNKPELSFQVVIPFDNFLFYQEDHAHFTLMIHNFVGLAYGVNVLKHSEYNEELVRVWVKEVQQKYSVALSEPLPVDTIFRDAAEADQLWASREATEAEDSGEGNE